MIVAKFGGSSVKDDAALLDCVNVVEKTDSIGVVVISATYNTTNELEEIFNLIKSGDELSAKGVWNQIQTRHRQMAIRLGQFVVEPLEELIKVLDNEFSTLISNESVQFEQRDALLSFGERLSSTLFYYTLKKRFPTKKMSLLNAGDIIRTDSIFGLATPDKKKIEKACCELDRETLYITQGFLGTDSDGRRTTLGREGSDYSATLFAEALDASEVHIWTDVDGVYNADPNIVSLANRIEYLTYEEATILAKAGAKVLFPKTLGPLIEKRIPLKVAKTSIPDGGHTWIGYEKNENCELGLLGLTAKERSNGLIITIVGRDVDSLDISNDEIDRGEGYRSFFHPEKDNVEVLNLWFERYFC